MTKTVRWRSVLASCVMAAATTATAVTGPARAAGETCDGKPATLVVTTPPSDGQVVGTDGDDVIVVMIGPPHALVVDGLDGNDTICGSAGTKEIHGDGGDDDLWGGANGSQVAPTLSGGVGNDQLHGDATAEYLEGGPGDDTVVGGGGNDILFGDSRHDTPLSVPAYSDDDILLGGKGDDRLVDDWGNDRLVGGPGHDNLLLGLLTGDPAESGCGVSFDASPTLRVGRGTVSGFGHDTFIGFERYVGGTATSTLIGTGGSDSLGSGNCGRARLIGRGGADHLVGFSADRGEIDAEKGDDVIHVAGPADVQGGPGDDRIELKVNGFAWFDGRHTISGGPGHDWVVDNAAGETIDLRRGVHYPALGVWLPIEGIENAHMRFPPIPRGTDATLIGTMGPNLLVGPSHLRGAPAFRALLRGLAGNDRLVGGRGDTAFGGPGHDVCTAQHRHGCGAGSRRASRGSAPIVVRRCAAHLARSATWAAGAPEPPFVPGFADVKERFRRRVQDGPSWATRIVRQPGTTFRSDTASACHCSPPWLWWPWRRSSA